MKAWVRQYFDVFFLMHKAVEEVVAAITGRTPRNTSPSVSSLGRGGKGSVFTVVLPVIRGERKAP